MTARNRTVGRPRGKRSPGDSGLKQRAAVRLTDAEAKRLRRAVAASGTTVLDFVATAVLAACEREGC